MFSVCFRGHWFFNYKNDIPYVSAIRGCRFNRSFIEHGGPGAKALEDILRHHLHEPARKGFQQQRAHAIDGNVS